MIRTLQRERPAPLDLDAIRRGHPLADVVAGVVPLKAAGRELKACCPFHQDRTPSFTIYDHGRRYQCFGCGAGGDVLDFVQQFHGVGLREAADLLTGGDLPTLEALATVQHDRHDRHDSERTDEALAIWNAAVPATGTMAERYLRARRLHLPLPDSIRFAWLPYGKQGPDYPVLVAAVVDAGGDLIGIQRTFLNPAGTGKAALRKAKLSLGRVSGGAIRLAPPSASLVVCEGLEDGLTLQQELGVGVWVSAGTSNLPTMQFPAGVHAVAIGGDGDDAGRMAAEKAARAFALQSLEARVFYPAAGFKDFNDELQGRTRA